MLKLNKKYDKHNSNGDYKMLKENDKGIVSIVVVIIFIIVIGLIVIGFGELSRNQSQQTIDNQLSSASYYAADSGINDILKYVINNINNSSASLSNNSCTGFSSTIPEINTFNSNNKSSTKITCATWTNNVTSLIYSNVGDSNNQIVYLNPSDLNNTDNYIDIQWTNLSNTNILGCSTDKDYYSSSSYNSSCNIGELRLDIAPPIGSGCNNISNCPSETIFAQATDGTTPTSNTFSTNSKPQRLKAFVTGDNTENLVIDCQSLKLLCGYINIRSLYANSNISIKAYSSYPNNDTPILFTGTQESIDVTAVTSGVARRVVAVANLQSSSPNNVSDYAIMSTKTLCKVEQVQDTTGSSSNIVTSKPTSWTGDTTACSAGLSP